jgi:hypothetical protein
MNGDEISGPDANREHGAPTGFRGELRDLSKMSPEQANAERRRRNHARFPPVNTNPSEDEARLGMNGAKQLTGPALARADVLAGARATYATLLVNLQKHEAMCLMYPNADASWQVYEGFYSKLQRCAETVAQLSGETLHIPARVIRPAREFVAIAPGRAPDVVPREVKPGLAPGPVDPFAIDGLNTVGAAPRNLKFAPGYGK